MRTIDWTGGEDLVIDRTRLPVEGFVISLNTLEELAGAISTLRARELWRLVWRETEDSSRGATDAGERRGC